MKAKLLTFATLCIAFSPAVSASADFTLDQVLAKIEARGADLKSMEARIVQKKWTDLLGEFDAGESGTLRFLKKDGAVYLRKDIATPRPNHLVLADGKAVFFQPGIKQAQVHQLGENKDKAEFLLIGFGTSRDALEKAYRIRLLGSEPVESRDAVMLELTPRSNQVSAYFSKIVLWIDTASWIPIQQKLVEPTEDFLLATFGDVRINPKLSKSDFELKLPKDVRIVGGND